LARFRDKATDSSINRRTETQHIPQKGGFQLKVPIRPSPSPKKRQVEVVVASESSQDFYRRKKEVFSKLQRNTDFAKSHPDVVQKYYGQHGFSKSFSTDETSRLLAAAPEYLRQASTTRPKLDRGANSTPPQDERQLPTSHEETTDIIEIDKGREYVKELSMSRFQKVSGPPLTFTNDIDDTRVPYVFQFVSDFIIRNGVKVVPQAKSKGCSCAGACIPAACACQVRTEIHDTKEIRWVTITPYMQHPQKPDLIVLRPKYIEDEMKPENHHHEILECSDNCGCSDSCWNRVVSRGRTLPLEIFKTPKCGFGVRCPIDIVQGQFIDVYLGEVITLDELSRREEAKGAEMPSYVFNLDWFKQSGCYTIDGEYFGSTMRFVNHSCEPNARSFTVMTNSEDQKVYHLAFFAIKDIPASQEITIDYQPQEAGAEIQEIVEQEDDKTIVHRCYCGTPKCRKYLWKSETIRRRKKRTHRK
jgi:[histone H3]-lysine9 N-trimethyltransferase SUV39H